MDKILGSSLGGFHDSPNEESIAGSIDANIDGSIDICTGVCIGEYRVDLGAIIDIDIAFTNGEDDRAKL